MSPFECLFESMGTSWKISIWDDVPHASLRLIEQTIRAYCTIFDHTYSRFRSSSLVSHMAQKADVYAVPPEFVDILKLYVDLFKASRGMLNPLVGDTLSDLGYNAKYTLQRKRIVRKVPDFLQVVKIIDAHHIELSQATTIDIGALGKGFAVDAVAHILDQHSLKHYLVDGSGDVYYQGPSPIKVGLEHPTDSSLVIGSMNMKGGAMCGSAVNRRTWAGIHHIINPTTIESTDTIIASWVTAENAALADGLATALFMCPPEYFSDFSFEYLLLNKDMKVKRSPKFAAELY